MSDEDKRYVTGKWREPGVPHKGWVCTGVEEVEGGFATCEMCEVAVIKHVHLMEHPDYGETLGVGCICAGHMEQDLVGARRRETTFKNKKQRSKRWLTREWKVSAKGNAYINVNNWNVVIYKKGSLWGGRISKRTSGETYFLKTWCVDSDTAKLQAFELLEALLKTAGNNKPTADQLAPETMR
jgi:hypothetical protein